MGIRITQSLLTARTLRDVNGQLQNLSTLQERLATGLRVNRPSDSPLDARRAISIRRGMARSAQFVRNLNGLEPLMRASEGAFNSVTNIIQRARELTIRAANETFTQTELDMTAGEINQLLEQAVVESNRKIDGKTIFGGTHTKIEAFSVTRDPVTDRITAVNYDGNSETINVQFSDSGFLAVNATGSNVFQSDVDIFSMLIGIRDDMLAGDQDNLRNVRFGELDVSQDQISRELTKIGAVENRVLEIIISTEDLILNLQEELSDRVDADYAETIINFNVAQNSYQAALNASARVIQNSLLDFLR
ncbi:MAG: flagellar hook-associated protein FlgL [Candidatus Hydrogenedentota bacterium]